MRRYKRVGEIRDSSNIGKNNPLESLNKKVLTLCNYSHIKDKHLSLEELFNIINEFDIKAVPIYLRLFNELPKVLFINFINENKIDILKVLDIHKKIKESTSFRIDEFNI